MVKKINSLGEMDSFAYEISCILKPGMVLALEGGLGVGKTTFVQFLAHHLQISEKVTSPTFNIVKSYNSILGIFHHLDAYRLEKIKDIREFDQYLYHKGITVIEWPKFLKINKPYFLIKIKFCGPSQREVETSDFIN